MRINRVDNNTNFQMALKINKAATPKLKELSIEKINQIADFAEKLKDLKHYDVHIDENLRYSIRSANLADNTDYLAELRSAESRLGKHYSYTNYDGGGEVEVGGFYPSQPNSFINKYGNAAKEEYAKFKKLNTNEQIIYYTKMLEEFENARLAKIQAAENARIAAEEASRKAVEQKNAALNELLNKYGYEEPLSVVETAKPVDSQKIKKGFLKRLFRIG